MGEGLTPRALRALEVLKKAGGNAATNDPVWKDWPRRSRSEAIRRLAAAGLIVVRQSIKDARVNIYVVQEA